MDTGQRNVARKRQMKEVEETQNQATTTIHQTKTDSTSHRIKPDSTNLTIVILHLWPELPLIY